MAWINKKEWIFIGVMTLLFVILNNPFSIRGLNSFNPIVCFIIYEFILFISLWFLSIFGFTALGIKVKSFRTILATFLTTFDFFIIINWTSSYVSYLTTGSANTPNIFIASEDGIICYLWQNLITLNSEMSAWLMFLAMTFTVFFIAVLVSIILPKKQIPSINA